MLCIYWSIPCDVLQQESAFALVGSFAKSGWEVMLPWVDPKLMTNGCRPMKAQLLLLKLGQILKCNLHSRAVLQDSSEARI